MNSLSRDLCPSSTDFFLTFLWVGFLGLRVRHFQRLTGFSLLLSLEHYLKCFRALIGFHAPERFVYAAPIWLYSSRN